MAHPVYREGDPLGGQPILVGHRVDADGRPGTVIAVHEGTVRVHYTTTGGHWADCRPDRIASLDPGDVPEALTLTLTTSQWDKALRDLHEQGFDTLHDAIREARS